MNVTALFDRALIRRRKKAERTPSGLFISDTARGKPQRGMMVRVGTGPVLPDGRERPLKVREGEQVVFARNAGGRSAPRRPRRPRRRDRAEARSAGDRGRLMDAVPPLMRAAAIDRFGGPDVLSIHKLPVPDPEPFAGAPVDTVLGLEPGRTRAGQDRAAHRLNVRGMKRERGDSRHGDGTGNR